LCGGVAATIIILVAHNHVRIENWIYLNGVEVRRRRHNKFKEEALRLLDERAPYTYTVLNCKYWTTPDAVSGLFKDDFRLSETHEPDAARNHDNVDFIEVLVPYADTKQAVRCVRGWARLELNRVDGVGANIKSTRTRSIFFPNPKTFGRRSL